MDILFWVAIIGLLRSMKGKDMNIVFWMIILATAIGIYYILLFIIEKATKLITKNKEEKEIIKNGQEDERNKE